MKLSSGYICFIRDPHPSQQFPPPQTLSQTLCAEYQSKKMASTTGSPVFQALSAEPITSPTTAYWWRTTGHDFANMLHEASYSEESQRRFLTFFRDNICPKLGSAPTPTSVKSGVGRDGDCFEYSFEFKGSTTAKPNVRFGVDLSPLRPVDEKSPLSIANSEDLIAALRERTPGFDDTWYHSLKRFFVYADAPTEKQVALIKAAGHQMSFALGCDIHRHLATPGRYFLSLRSMASNLPSPKAANANCGFCHRYSASDGQSLFLTMFRRRRYGPHALGSDP